jgi:hypothetical protein
VLGAGGFHGGGGASANFSTNAVAGHGGPFAGGGAAMGNTGAVSGRGGIGGGGGASNGTAGEGGGGWVAYRFIF